MIEKDLQAKVNNDLRKLNIKFWHCEKGNYHKGKTHRAGWPDLIIFPGKGNAFFIELKTPIGKLTQKQIDFKMWCMDMKYNFYIVKSWQEWLIVKEKELCHEQIERFNNITAHNGKKMS